MAALGHVFLLSCPLTLPLEQFITKEVLLGAGFLLLLYASKVCAYFLADVVHPPPCRRPSWQAQIRDEWRDKKLFSFSSLIWSTSKW